MGLKDLKNIVEGMGRPRSEMKRLIDSVSDTIGDHLWKVFAYHKTRKRYVNGWVKSLNKHIMKLQRYNVQKGGKGLNYNEEGLRDEFTDTLFGTEMDIEVLIRNWSGEGYPVVFVSKKDHEKLKKLCNKYVDVILAKKRQVYSNR